MRAFLSPRPWWHSLLAPAVVIVLGLTVSGDNFALFLATSAAAAYVLTASFNMIYGYAGVFSMGHVALYGIGAYVACLAEMRIGISFIPATLLAMVATALFGVVLWWPTRNLKDLFLAIATLGFAVTVQELFAKWTSITGGGEGLLGIPPAEIGGEVFLSGTQEYFWIAAVAALITWEVCGRLTSSGAGRKMIALREAPVALSAVGVSPGQPRLVAFVVSSALAGLAGSIFAHQALFISSDSFGLDRLIILILAVLIGGAGTTLGPVLGVAALVLVDEVGVATGGYNTLILGAAIVLLLGYGRGGILGLLNRLLGKVRLPGRGKVAAEPVEQAELVPVALQPDAVLSVDAVSVAFGGVKALQDVSVEMRPGRVLGLIGPNGAGKTTLVNAITGHVRPTSGRIEVAGQRLDGRRPDVIARRGVVRTFQTPKLIPEVSLIGNVMVGFARHARASVIEEILDAPRARTDTRTELAQARGLLARLGIDRDLDKPAGAAPYAIQRLTEIARALAARPAFLLLDEPGAGLNDDERSSLAGIIRELAWAGISLLLIDHNVSFVAEVSDDLVVLDGGKRLAAGVPADVLRREDVVGAYFGGAA